MSYVTSQLIYWSIHFIRPSSLRREPSCWQSGHFRLSMRWLQINTSATNPQSREFTVCHVAVSMDLNCIPFANVDCLTPNFIILMWNQSWKMQIGNWKKMVPEGGSSGRLELANRSTKVFVSAVQTQNVCLNLRPTNSMLKDTTRGKGGIELQGKLPLQ